MQQILQGGATDSQRQIQAVLRRLDWNHLRYFLCMAESGSLRRAAAASGASATTISRAIEALERTLGLSLFSRLPEGFRLTDDGRAILKDVLGIDQATQSIARRSRMLGEPLRGVVRIAITEGLGNYWLLPQLIEFSAANKFLLVELNCTMEAADVARMQADIAIQFHRPTNPELIVVKLGRLHSHPFASLQYAARHGLPRSLEEFKSHRIIQQYSPQLPADALQRALQVDTLEGIVGIRANASSGVLYAVERHAGIGWLPTYCIAFGARFAALDFPVRHSLDIYLTYHPDMRKSPHHLVMIDWIRRIFDPARYPCFRDEFIAPLDLVPMLAGVAQLLGGRGFLATDPSGQSGYDLPENVLVSDGAVAADAD